MLSKLDLDPKCQGHSRNQKLMTWGTKKLPPQKNLRRGCLSNWCDADADTDSSKTICRPPPYRGVDIKTINGKRHLKIEPLPQNCLSFNILIYYLIQTSL